MAGEGLPVWLRGHMRAEDLPAIEATVRETEERSPIEVVPMIVRGSSVRGQVRVTLTLMVLAVAMMFLLAFHDWLHPIELVILAIVSLPASLFLAVILEKSDRVARFVIPDGDEVRQVHQRAFAEFCSQKVTGTRGRNGVLLFVSVFERRVVVWPDEGLASVLPAPVCVKLAEGMAAHLRDANWATAFTTTIQAIGEASASLPRPAEKRDELGNGLVIKE